MKRITPAFVTLIMLFVVGGLVAAYFARKLFATEPVAEVQTARVPVAVSDLKPGTVITEGHLIDAPLRRDKLERDTILSRNAIIGRVVKVAIKNTEPIRTAFLYPAGERPPLAVSEGMRATTVSLGSTAAVVDGLIQPGQYVDVHFTPSTVRDERFRGGLTMTLFKGVKVLAINRQTQTNIGVSRDNTTTLELTPEQANIMILASARGEINLTYNPEGKGDGGVAVSREDRATLEEILGLEPLPEQEPPFEAEIFMRSGRSTIRFENGRRTTTGRGTVVDPSPGYGDSVRGINTGPTATPQDAGVVPGGNTTQPEITNGGPSV